MMVSLARFFNWQSSGNKGFYDAEWNRIKKNSFIYIVTIIYLMFVLRNGEISLAEAMMVIMFLLMHIVFMQIKINHEPLVQRKGNNQEKIKKTELKYVS